MVSQARGPSKDARQAKGTSTVDRQAKGPSNAARQARGSRGVLCVLGKKGCARFIEPSLIFVQNFPEISNFPIWFNIEPNPHQ